MGLFSRRPANKTATAATHIVEIHFAQPMMPSTRHAQEDGIVGQLMPQLGATARVVGGGTALGPFGEPESSDITMEVATENIDDVVDQLTTVLERNGLSRGSWITVNGTRRSIGRDEFVLLRTRLHDDPVPDLTDVTIALQRALGDGSIGWHDETYPGIDGPVYVFSGPSAEHIIATLDAEMRRHAQLAAAVLLPAFSGDTRSDD